MRPQDRIALCEANPDEREALIAALGRDRRLSIVGTDGYVALNAYLPPKERRGLVLIDPPFEAPDEAERVERALERALRKWPDRNLYRLAPDPRSPSRLPFSQFGRRARRAQHPAARTGRRERDRSARMARSRWRALGFSIVNPPHTLIDEARTLMPWLAETLGRDGQGRHLCAWLTEPR